MPRFTEPFPEQLPKSIYQILCTSLAHPTAIVFSPNTTEDVKHWRSPKEETTISNHYPLLCQPPELQKLCFYNLGHPASQLSFTAQWVLLRLQKSEDKNQEPWVASLLLQSLLPSPSVFLMCCSTPSYFIRNKEKIPHTSSPRNFCYARCICESKHELVLPFLTPLPPFCYYSLVLLY